MQILLTFGRCAALDVGWRDRELEVAATASRDVLTRYRRLVEKLTCGGECLRTHADGLVIDHSCLLHLPDCASEQAFFLASRSTQDNFALKVVAEVLFALVRNFVE